MTKNKKNFIITSLLFLLLAIPVVSNAAVTINKTKLSLNVQKSYQLNVVGTTKGVKWTSSNKAIATVSNTGVVKGIKKGSCQAVAIVGTKKYYCSITVKQPVTAIKISKTTATIKTAKLITLTADALPANANNKSILWTSSNTKVATVSSTGVVKGISKGTCVITAAAKDGSGKKATCKVTVYTGNIAPISAYQKTIDITINNANNYYGFAKWTKPVDEFGDPERDTNRYDYYYCINKMYAKGYLIYSVGGRAVEINNEQTITGSANPIGIIVKIEKGKIPKITRITPNKLVLVKQSYAKSIKCDSDGNWKATFFDNSTLGGRKWSDGLPSLIKKHPEMAF